MEHCSLVGHRGSPLEFPENSIPGIARCLDLSARFIEIDVQVTLDRKVILHHDRTLDRCCGVGGQVHRHTLEQLNRLSFSEPDYFKNRFIGLPPATLEAVVALCRRRPGTTLFIEVKSVAVEAFGVGDVLNAIGAAVGRPGDDEVLISYRQDLLDEARPGSWPRTGLILDDWDLAASSKAADHEYLFCNVRRLPETGRLDGRTSRLGVYDVIDPALGARLLERGADLVETFDLPGMLREHHD